MKKFKLTNYTKGFTLIELLVVIAIIGILGAIVYAPFQTARKKGRDAQKISELKSLATSLSIYADDHKGEYPNCLDLLSNYGSIPKNSNITGDSACDVTTTTNPDPNKYNYTTYYYTDNSGETHVTGYHLWTHLETLSPALSGSANCSGVNTTSGTPSNASKYCLIGNYTASGSADEGEYTFKYDPAWTDSTCQDTRKCIFDISSNS